MSTWRIIITSGIIKARATCCSFLLPARTRHMKARFGVANGLGASSNTTRVKPHEFFDHTGSRARRAGTPLVPDQESRVVYGARRPADASDEHGPGSSP